MSVQQLRTGIAAALSQHFTGVPVYTEGEEPQGAFFQPMLISATYERQREGRYAVVYRFGIHYRGGTLLEAEDMADRLLEALALIEVEGSLFRGSKQIWSAGKEGEDPFFTVEYNLHLMSEKPEAVSMAQVSGGGRLK
ncbi:DUF6838 family protein [Paenibacillus sp. sgz500958]|uniref:phage tail terminator family protein n=1 Tax=Paenibacillus sp. sgz500958 TaxID=3242475 RepID=UPI0036D361D1